MTAPEPIQVGTYLDLATKILTEKQLRVLQLRLAGHSNRTIALALHIDESTVRGLHARALARLRTAQRKEAA